MYPFGIAVCAIITDGWTCHVIGAVVTVAALAAYVLEGPRFLRLVFMWCAGFLLIITPEGLGNADLISRLYGVGAFDTASRCLVASHFAVLLGHDLAFSEAQVRPASSPWRLSFSIAIPIAIAMWMATTIYLLPVAVQAFRGGRVETGMQSHSAFTVIAEGLAASTRVFVPITCVWIARRRSGAARRLLLAVTALSLALELIFAVRFVMLFIVVGCVCAWLAPRPFNRRTMTVLIMTALALAMASAVTKNSRTYGLSGADVGEIVGEASPHYFVMAEDSVKSMTQAVVYAERRGFTNGRTTSALVFFFIPRAVWPDKPTMIGHWLPREFGRIDPGFSAAPAFTGGTYVDVGLWGSVLLWFLAGLVFGVVERGCARIFAATEDARLLVVAPLFGASFFAVRSPDTTGVVLSGIILTAMAFLLVTGRYAAVRRLEPRR